MTRKVLSFYLCCYFHGKAWFIILLNRILLVSRTEYSPSQSFFTRRRRVRTEHHLSSFKCGFLNIFSRQNLLRSLSRLLFLLRWNKYGTKKCLKNYFPFDFWDDSTLANQGAGKTIEKPLKELRWSQQIPGKLKGGYNISQQGCIIILPPAVHKFTRYSWTQQTYFSNSLIIHEPNFQ